MRKIRRQLRVIILCLCVFVSILLYVLFKEDNTWTDQGGQPCSSNHLKTLSPTPPLQRSTNRKEPKHFVRGRDQDMYMYSAILVHRAQNLMTSLTSGITNIMTSSSIAITEKDLIVTTQDGYRNTCFVCCLFYRDKEDITRKSAVSSVPAISYRPTWSKWTALLEYFEAKPKKAPARYIARQYICPLPNSSSPIPSHVSLSSSFSCPSLPTLPVLQPPRVVEQLAICCKVIHGAGLDPEHLIEWFEMQKLLGVDKVLLHNLNTSGQLVQRVLKHYQEEGILDLPPYELPGQPWDRALSEKFKFTSQFGQDEQMAVDDCRVRLSGYDMVLGIDLDEVVIPTEDISLKQFFKTSLSHHPRAAGFNFNTEFFIYGWGPSRPDNDLLYTRYFKSTEPRMECFKYVYLPSRVVHTTTHFVTPSRGYTLPTLPQEEVILHHYRHCPDVWKTCKQDRRFDDVMLRYAGRLGEKVKAVRKVTGVTPKWKVSGARGAS